MKNFFLTLWQKHGRIARFVLSGGSGATVHFTVLILLVERGGFHPVLASVGAFVCAFFVSFSLQKLWTFKNFSKEKTPRQMGVYLGIALMNLGINAGLMYLFVETLALQYILAQLITSSMIASMSYFLYKHVVFGSDMAPPA